MTELAKMPEFMTAREVARVVRKTEHSLAQDRLMDRGLAYTRVGRKVLYARADVEAYLRTHRTDPAEPPTPNWPRGR